MLQPGFTLTRYETKALRYDTDLGDQILIRTRLNKDENGIIRTPVTPLLMARLVDLADCKAPRARQLEPRQVESCFSNPVNINGQSVLTTFVPYSPVDQTNHKGHIKEIRDFADVVSITYRGEDSERR